MLKNNKVIICANNFWYLNNFKKELLTEINKKYKLKLFIGSNDLGHEITKYNYSLFQNTGRRLSFKNLTLFIFNIIKFIYIYLKFTPNKVIIFNPQCSLLVLIANKILLNKMNIYVTITGMGSLMLKYPKLYSFLIKFLYSGIKYIFVQNSDDYKWVRRNFKNTKIQKLNGSGVNTSIIHLKENSNNKITFGFSSRIISEKGIKIFIDLAYKIKLIHKKNVDFVIVGKYDFYNTNISKTYLNFIQSCNYVKSYINKKNHLEIMSKFDYLILPNYGYEGIPKIIIEALYMDIPVIASNISGNRDIIVDKKNGILFENIHDLEKITLNIIDKKINFDMKKYGRSYITTNYNEKDITKKYIETIFST